MKMFCKGFPLETISTTLDDKKSWDSPLGHSYNIGRKKFKGFPVGAISATLAATYFCKGSPLGDVSATWDELFLKGIPPWVCSCHIGRHQCLQEIPPWGYSLHMGCHKFFKRLIIGDVASTWYATIFASFLLVERSSTWADTDFQGFPPWGRSFHLG